MAPIAKNGLHIIQALNSMNRGLKPIAKNIVVVDERGNHYEATYPKRAKGLVKNGRARFIDTCTICLACPPNLNLEDERMLNEEFVLDEEVMIIAEMDAPTGLTFDYVKQQFERITSQTDYLNNTIGALSSMSDSEAKAQALNDVVRCREATNQQVLKLLEKMYDDLKSQKAF